MAHSLPHLARAVAVGFALSLVASTVLLLVLAAGRAQRPCEYPGTEECAFELQTNAEVARLQSYAALGCALIGAGLLVTLRRKEPQ